MRQVLLQKPPKSDDLMQVGFRDIIREAASDIALLRYRSELEKQRMSNLEESKDSNEGFSKLKESYPRYAEVFELDKEEIFGGLEVSKNQIGQTSESANFYDSTRQDFRIFEGSNSYYRDFLPENNEGALHALTSTIMTLLEIDEKIKSNGLTVPKRLILSLNEYQGAFRLAVLAATDYDFVGPLNSNGLALVYSEKGYGCIDREGEEDILCQYGRALSFADGVAWVKSEEGYALTDIDGRELGSGTFDEVKPFTNGLAPVRSGALTGYIDLNLNIVWGCSIPEYVWEC